MVASVIFITFDSNVWRQVASPLDFPKEPSAKTYLELNKHCKSGHIVACLSESIFNLEGIMRNDRKKIIGNDRGKIDVAKAGFVNIIESRISIGPDLDAHPGSSYYLKKHLDHARLANFKLLYCPRLGGIKNKDILNSDYLGFTEEISKKFSDVISEIESWGCGQAQIRAIGNRYAPFWLDGLQSAPESEQKNIADGVAEWADADSVAAHIAYGNTIFCTKDTAKKVGVNSVFSANNITRLNKKYGFVCKTPEDIYKQHFEII